MVLKLERTSENITETQIKMNFSPILLVKIKRGKKKLTEAEY